MLAVDLLVCLAKLCTSKFTSHAADSDLLLHVPVLLSTVLATAALPLLPVLLLPTGEAQWQAHARAAWKGNGVIQFLRPWRFFFHAGCVPLGFTFPG
jgi:hypothetical protein